MKVKTSEIIYLCSIYCLLVFLIYSFFLFVCFVLVWFGLGWIFVYLLPEYDSSAVSSRLETGFSLLPSSCLSVCLSRSVRDLTVSLLSHSTLVSLMSPGSDSLSPFLRRWSPSFRPEVESLLPQEVQPILLSIWKVEGGEQGEGVNIFFIFNLIINNDELKIHIHDLLYRVGFVEYYLYIYVISIEYCPPPL